MVGDKVEIVAKHLANYWPLESQSRAELAAISAKTRRRWVGELKITLKVSEAAACCSRASASLPATVPWTEARSIGLASVLRSNKVFHANS